ncbi:diguanylate cyclase (GGDEF)-like protein [Pararhizobium capsulatum DSM 1112]|uniref:diguanylate cyclase n=1 Tax=Pararhizobium capsulatum DSM 1112 TaxID=1121113 RepID=A0ABU0BUA7_9HYPH|nr:diguanylate cyclase (GGDEF)-like protein [Pararhizobium capsulatum DSM 1112]
MTETVNRDGWMLCIASDITHLRADERDLRQDRDLALRASQTDELTGISSRRYVMNKLEEMIMRNLPDQPREGCLCIFDIDFFKGINDLYGHQTGDDVLLDFARRVQPIVRRHDCFGRVGGEEFMLLLPDTSAEEGEGIVRRIMEIVRASRPLSGAPLFRYTCSAGLATMAVGDSAKVLYARADAALYSAKQSGRDRIMIGAR